MFSLLTVTIETAKLPGTLKPSSSIKFGPQWNHWAFQNLFSVDVKNFYSSLRPRNTTVIQTAAFQRHSDASQEAHIYLLSTKCLLHKPPFFPYLIWGMGLILESLSDLNILPRMPVCPWRNAEPVAHSGRLSLWAIDFSIRPSFSSHAFSLHLKETPIVKCSPSLVLQFYLRASAFRLFCFNDIDSGKVSESAQMFGCLFKCYICYCKRCLFVFSMASDHGLCDSSMMEPLWTHDKRGCDRTKSDKRGS